VFENRVLRRILGPTRDEVKAGWLKLHNEELRDLNFSPSIFRNNQIEEDEMGEACSTNWERRKRIGYW
jgi:hypothetical protein